MLILKWIGIVLLCIVALFLLIVIVSLTVPLRYGGKGSYEQQFIGHFYVTWLMHLITVRADVVNSKMELTARLFGFRIFSYPQTEARQGKKQNSIQETRQKQSRHTSNEDETESDEDLTDHLESEKEQFESNMASRHKKEFENQEINIDKPVHDNHESHFVGDKLNDSKHGKRTKHRKKFSFSFPHPIQWLTKCRIRCAKFLQKIGKTIQSMFYRLSEIKLFLQDEKNRASFRKIKRTVFNMIRYVLPQKKRIDCKFGTGDPALTGQIMGLFAVFYPKYYKDTKIVPDFENRIFEGRFWFKGRIRGIHFIIALIQLWCDKNIRLLFKKFVLSR